LFGQYNQVSHALQQTRASGMATKAALLASRNDSSLRESLQLALESMRLNPSPESDEVIRNDLALIPVQIFSRDYVDYETKAGVKFEAPYKVTSVAFGKERGILATGSVKDKKVVIEILDTGNSKKSLRLTDTAGDNVEKATVAWHPDNRIVAAA